MPVATAAPDVDDESCDVKDNAMRSVSMRINTSDFGRIKVIARRLRVRESDIFRVLIKLALGDIAPLCDVSAPRRDLLGLWCERGADLTRLLHLDPEAVDHLLNGDTRPGAGRIPREDIELLAMLNAPSRYLALRLQALTGEAPAAEAVHEAIRGYVLGKYGE